MTDWNEAESRHLLIIGALERMDERCLGCDKRPEVYGSSWCANCHDTIPHAVQERMIKMRNAILWALGENGEFKDEPPPLNNKYRRRFWWRTELRSRAFSAGEQHGG